MQRTREQIINTRYQDDFEVAKWIDQNIKGKSIGDLGCGWGVIISGLKNRGWDVWGVDISIEGIASNVIECVRSVDLSKEVYLHKADIAMSLEVAEHLPRGSEDIFIKNLMKLNAETIIMTVATLGQEAKSHTNIKPRRMWIEKIEAQGYKENEAMEYKFKKDLEGKLEIKAWYSWNIMIFNKKINEKR